VVPIRLRLKTSLWTTTQAWRSAEAEPLVGGEVDPVNLTLEDYAHQRSLIVERNLAFIRFRVGALAGSGFPA
jgi:hypothetical protein